MEKDWLFATDEYICDLRTVAVLVKDNKILVQRDSCYDLKIREKRDTLD